MIPCAPKPYAVRAGASTSKMTVVAEFHLRAVTFGSSY